MATTPEAAATMTRRATSPTATTSTAMALESTAVAPTVASEL